jgi:Arc/MetJ-type ribon-helix-helix transcriptional regulator
MKVIGRSHPGIERIMASITSALPKELRAWIEQEVAAGHFESEAAVIVDAVRRAKDSSYRWEEDEDLVEAIANVERGETRPLTEHVMRELSDRARENARKGHQVKFDVTY